MKTLAEIFRWRQKQAEPAVLATVVHVTGSASRHVGARMLVSREGRLAGHISGGCLEKDVLQHAEPLLAGPAASPVLLSYNTESERDRIWGMGMGCQGTVDVLLQRLDQAESIDALWRFRQRRQRCVLATVIRRDGIMDVRLGDSAAISESGEELHAPGLQPLLPQLRALVKSWLDHAGDVWPTGQARPGGVDPLWFALGSGRVQMAFELAVPPVQLVVFGAGPSAPPLTRMAQELGWQVIMADQRHPITIEQYPAAERVIAAPVEHILQELAWDRRSSLQRTAAVVTSHDFVADCHLVPALLALPLPYLGVLGSRRRGAKLLETIAELNPNLQSRANLHTPMGLDLGAETPEEIALAVLAEVQAAMAHASARSLRNLSGPLHRNKLPESTQPEDAAAFMKRGC